MSRLDDALRRAVDTLDGLDASFALVGGMAVSVLAAPRMTGDVDLAVAVGSDADAESVARGFAAAGYRIASLLQQEQMGRLAGVRAVDSATGVSLDLLFAMCGAEPEIVETASPLEVLPGVVVPVASVGGLLVMKLLSRDDRRRPTDADDLNTLSALAREDDWAQASRLVDLITARGANRGRDLAADLNRLRAGDAY